MSTRRYGRITVEVSNEDKVLFPKAGLTKGDLIEYYDRIADRILPHLKNRPLVVQRFPDGIDKPGFYQKQVPEHFPRWLSSVRVELQSKAGQQDLAVCDNRAALAYLANQACVTLHPWLSRKDDLDHPDLMVIDLDPSEDDFDLVRDAALRVRELFDALGLRSFPKLTGSRGVHIVVPLGRSDDFDTVRGFARSAMELLAARHPRTLTTEQRKDKRQGRLYLDAGRNAYGQTAVAPWSVRPLAEAPLAVPVFWRDLEHRTVGPRDYTIRNVFRRIAQHGDPWASMRRYARSLREPRERLKKLRRDEGT